MSEPKTIEPYDILIRRDPITRKYTIYLCAIPPGHPFSGMKFEGFDTAADAVRAMNLAIYNANYQNERALYKAEQKLRRDHGIKWWQFWKDTPNV